MHDEAKKRLESRMLRKLHVRFGVGVRVQPPGLHHVKVEPRSNNAIAAGLSSFASTKHHQALDLADHVRQFEDELLAAVGQAHPDRLDLQQALIL